MVEQKNEMKTERRSGADDTRAPSGAELLFRQPNSLDGMPVHTLIQASPPLDTNSVYCNLLQCTHFAPTCVVVELKGEIVAFMSAYVKPDAPNVLFVWQMVVAAAGRGQGVAGRMLTHLLSREHLSKIQFIETTISPGNAPSESVFLRFASTHDAHIDKSIFFSKDDHFHGQHDDEVLYRIGPFSLSNPS